MSQNGIVYHADVWGSRKSKEALLFSESLAAIEWDELILFSPYHFFVPFDAQHAKAFDKGFALGDLFSLRSKGIITARDDLAVAFDGTELKATIARFIDPSKSDISTRTEFFGKKKEGKYLPGDTRSWDLPEARKALRSADIDSRLARIAYRPFDFRTFYNGLDLVDWPRPEVMRNFSTGYNIGLSFNRRIEDDRPFTDVLALDTIIQHHSLSLKEANDVAPLYIFADRQERQSDAFAPNDRTLNLDPKLYAAICAAAGIDPADQAGPDDDFRTLTGDARPSEVKVFDYIYGVLHSPDYRATFAEFLKIDFPRVPYPPSPAVFAHVSEKGEALRRLHLMEAAAIGDAAYPFRGQGDDVVAAGYPKFESSPLGEGNHPQDGGGASAARGADGAGAPPPPAAPAVPLPVPGRIGRVHINATQYFDNVPEIAWSFHIGGYQPTQKWLKDRRGRALSWDDLGHYAKIVKILTETDRIMREIELPLETASA